LFLLYFLSFVVAFQVRLKRSVSQQGESCFEVCGIDISEEIDKPTKMSLTMQLTNLAASTLAGTFRYGSVDDVDLMSPKEDDDDSDGEEPILSGKRK